MTTTNPTQPRTPAEALRWAAERVDPVPPATLVCVATAGQLRTWADELDAAPAVYALPAEPPAEEGDGTPRVRLVTLPLCDLCLSGAGGECHVPGCALWMNRAPDLPLSTQPPAQEADR